MSSASLFQISYLALWGIVLFQALVLIEIVRKLTSGQLASSISAGLSRDDGLLETGIPAPIFTATDIKSGRLINSDDLLGQHVLLVFVAPDCSACQGIDDEINSLSWRDQVQIVTLCQGSTSDCAQWSNLHMLDTLMVLDEGGQIAKAFRIRETPTAVLIDESWSLVRYGLLRSQPLLGLETWDVNQNDRNAVSYDILEKDR